MLPLADSHDNPYNYEVALQHFNFDPDSDDNYMSFVTQFTYQTIWPDPSGVGQTSFIAVNGQLSPTVPVVRGSATLMRFLYVTNERNSILKVADPSCTITLLARDGIFHQGSYITVTRMAFTPASRADYAIICTPPLTASYPYSIRVYADPLDYGPFNGHTVAQDNVFTLVVSLPPTGFTPLAVPTSLAPVPSYLRSLMTNTSSATVNIAFISSETVDENGNVQEHHSVNNVLYQGLEGPLATR